MKANELRIGNWVARGDDQFPITSATISGLERGTSLGVEPIPLDNRWFIRFGFTWTRSGKYFYDEFALGKTCVDDIYSISFETGSFYRKLRYVHELQNIYFAIMGEELIINPDYLI